MAKEKKDAAFEKAAFEWLEKNTDTALLFAQNLVGILLQNYNGLATHYEKAGAKAKAKAVTAFVEAIQSANGENRLRGMGDGLCCCGVEGVPGFVGNTFNYNHFIFAPPQCESYGGDEAPGDGALHQSYVPNASRWEEHRSQLFWRSHNVAEDEEDSACCLRAGGVGRER